MKSQIWARVLLGRHFPFRTSLLSVLIIRLKLSRLRFFFYLKFTDS